MGRSRAESRDLAVVAGAALLSVGLVALPFGGLPKALALLPLVLLLPGYALTAAFFPERSLPAAERLLYSVALSAGAASLGGLAWQLAFELERFAWAGLLAAIAVVGCAIAYGRRRGALEPGGWTGRLPMPGAPAAIAGLLAVAIAVVAVVTATDGLQDQRAESHFSALWAVPGPGQGRQVEIGVWNHQGAVHRYRVEVRGGGRRVWSWKGKLGARERLETVIGEARLPSSARLDVALFRDGAIYRRVELQIGAGA